MQIRKLIGELYFDGNESFGVTSSPAHLHLIHVHLLYLQLEVRQPNEAASDSV